LNINASPLHNRRLKRDCHGTKKTTSTAGKTKKTALTAGKITNTNKKQ